ACCLIFAGLLQGCGATLQTCPDVSSVQAKQPSVSTPAPAQPYSKQWQQEVQDWQKLVQESRQKLMGTQLMSD
ncbi:MAG: hypothetical protein KIG95_08555, partial [Comamonas sp.]|nr:hypothetical protein [Comamonas sp.]